MKSFKLFFLFITFLSISLSGCDSNEGSVDDLKGILENQKDKSTVNLSVEGSDYKEIYFLRNDGIHPRLLYIKMANDVQEEMLRNFWRAKNFSTAYHKDNGVFIAKFKNSLDSAVLFTKYYLYEIQKVDRKKKIKYETTQDFVVQ